MSPRAQLLVAAGAAGLAGAWLLARHLGRAWDAGTAQGWLWLTYVGQVPMASATATAFLGMQTAARAAGVELTPTSGFRTMAEQEELYRQYQAGKRSAVVARPGHSNHQDGQAVDIAVGNSTTSKAYLWLAANAARWGFRRTVDSEPWHWEFSER